MEYNKEKRILYCYFDESLSIDELESAVYRITHETEYPPDVDTLWNMEKIDFRGIDQGVIQQVISMRRQFPERGDAKVAIIAPGDLGFGIGRMYEVFSEVAEMPQNIYIFRSIADAEKWLLTD